MANLEYIKGTTGDLETSALWLTDEERSALYNFLTNTSYIKPWEEIDNILKALEEAK